MYKVTIPPNDELRVETLKSYNILDSAAEKIFDTIAQLAALITQCPIGTISFVDRNRAWTKSAHGEQRDDDDTDRASSICGHIILSDDLLEVPDLTEDPRFKQAPVTKKGIVFYAGFPLIADNGFRIGALCVKDHVRKNLTQEQRKSLQDLAMIVMTLLETKKSEFANNQAIRHRQHLQFVEYVITKNISESENIERSLDEVLKIICRELGWTIGVVYQVTPEKKELQASQVWEESFSKKTSFIDETKNSTFKKGECLPGLIWETKKAVWMSDLTSELTFKRETINDNHLRSGFGFPIVLDGHVLGVVEFYSEEKRTADFDVLSMLNTVGNLIGFCINRQKLEELMLHQSLHDTLTNLPNRTLLMDRFQNAIYIARRHQNLAAIMYLDIDNLKNINNLHGRAEGDKLIVEVAKRIQHSIRESDTVARLDNNEFVILLSFVKDTHTGIEIAEKIIKVLQNDFIFGETIISITANIGLAFYPKDDLDKDHLLKHANNAMHMAKEKGKNKIYVHSDSLRPNSL